MRRLIFCALASLLPLTAAPHPRKVVFIAGLKSHGPGEHEYLKSIKLLKVMLDRSPNVHDVRSEVYFNGWPENPAVLDTADTIVLLSDGQDHDGTRAPIFTPERMKVVERAMNRGCGFILFHYATYASYEYADQVMEWNGGRVQWDDAYGPASAIKTLETEVKPGTPGHPVLRGIAFPWILKDEYYYKLHFRPNDPRLKPILQVPVLAPDPPDQTVAWAVERKNGGRGFGTSTGHFFSNWKEENYRRLMLNAILWTAHAEVPDGGVQSQFVEEDEVNRTLLTNPIPILILTGDGDPGHSWKETTRAIASALNSEEPRFQITVGEDPEVLARPDLNRYKLIVLNYVNWNNPGPSESARANFAKYLSNGGSLSIIHFADAAFGPDLPGGAKAVWPEFHNICARVWDESKSTHDSYGRMHVTLTDTQHPAARNVQSFDLKDELYGRQQGTLPIHILATAGSKATGHDEPVAFVYSYGKGRVFQTVLGHDVAAIQSPGLTQLIRYGSLWAARERQP